MTIIIEKMRADIARENRRFAVSALVAAPVLVGAGFAIGYCFKPAPAPPPQVIILQQSAAAPK